VTRRDGEREVSDPARHPQPTDDVAADLVEYLVVVMPDVDSLATLVPALAEMAGGGRARILDLVALVKHDDGAIEVLEFEAVSSLAALADVEGQVGRLLSENDLAMASVALRPGTAGVVLVAENRWAEPLASAARRAGGQIVGGERVPPSRVEAVLADSADEDQSGA
jgi:Family of unknown function (DUF6325)